MKTYLSPMAAAKRKGVHVRTITGAIARGAIVPDVAIRTGRRLAYGLSERTVDAFLPDLAKRKK